MPQDKADILADYREWREGLPARIGTHGGRCHMRHERCMIHRLAHALEQERHVLSQKNLTDQEREAVEWAAYAAQKMYEHTASATLMDLLKRLGGGE